MSKIQNAPKLLMPKATAMWMIENTPLTFEQIGEFTGLHSIEVQALADGDVSRGTVGRDPLQYGELSQEELAKAVANPNYKMKAARSELPPVKVRAKGPKYTPVSRRGDKPDAIAWIIKHHPEVSEAQLCKLIGTTKPTIASVRDRTHPNMQSIQPRHPAELGLCTYAELEAASNKGLKAQGKDPAAVKAERAAKQEAPKEETPVKSSGFDFSNFLKGTGSGSSN